jgi:hypothetical protein
MHVSKDSSLRFCLGVWRGRERKVMRDEIKGEKNREIFEKI